MYRSFKNLLVADEAALRDQARIKALERERNGGLRLAAVLMALGGACCLALAAGGVYVKLRAASAPPEAGWTMMGVGLFFGVMMLVMARAFYRETTLCALAGYLKAPQDYDFVRGRVEDSFYLGGGSRASARTVVKGTYGAGLPFMEEFDPGLWGDAVAERGEGGMKPGDDRYDQKGRRARLPLDVWLLLRRGARGPAYLAGIPAAALGARR